MNEVRELRKRAGVTQSSLANAAGTSQPTIAAYEAGRKAPTITTLRRLAEAAGLEMSVQFHPALTREDRRSLALHRAIADRLTKDSVGVLEKARMNVDRMSTLHPGAASIIREWRALLDRPLGDLVAILVDPSPRARELRHVTPFAGVLSAEERAALYRRFREDEQQRAARQMQNRR